MSEPQRRSFPGATPGQEPGEGIADPVDVEGGTLPSGAAAAADEQDVDPGGYPHEPAAAVPANPTDATDSAEDDAAALREQREAVRDGEAQGSRGAGWERE